MHQALFTLCGERNKFFTNLKEEIYVVDNEQDILLNYLCVVESPSKALLSMTNGPVF